MSKIDEFKEYARKKIVEKLRDNNENDETAVIHPYDGEDSFYSGSDEEYKEFLDELDMEINEAEPVENTQKFNLGDFAKVKGVVDKVKEAAENLVEAATKVTAKQEEEDETRFEKLEEEEINAFSEIVTDKIDGIDERLGDVSEVFNEIKAQVGAVAGTAVGMDKRIQELEIKLSSSVNETSADLVTVHNELSEIKAVSEQIRDALNGVSKLNDSVFDMKNTLQNNKTAVTDLQIAFTRLKKKTVTGIVILSVLGFIVLAMEVINLLA